jgi:signal transduction histidine kinase
MTAAHPQIRRLSVRVALGATLLVGLAYLLIAAAVVTFVTANLTSQIDDRLVHSLQREPQEPPPDGGALEPRPGDRPFGPLLLAWTISSDGDVQATVDSVELPAELQSVTAPRTVNINGTELRIAGATFGDDRMIVAQSLESVSDARSTIIVAELLIGPVLLAIVFLGAVTIGRRVAMPVEFARRRQLEFTADASHELRTPLAVIEAHTSLALAHDRSTKWYRGAFGRVDHESKRMHRLLDDLLWLARFDATQAPPNAEPVDLGILASQAADRFAPLAETKHLGLDVSGTELGAVVAAPPEWLDRLLGTLIDNACKYSPEGGRIAVSVAFDGSRVRLTVDDSGPGIPDAERSRIFDRFHRATDGPGGAGLGLAIADSIVRATGGHWTVGRSPADGARMSVTWPAALGGSGRREPGASPAQHQPAVDPK